ncbi:DUF4345 domain-containing protein [Aureibacter tunicatorum]|uniref:DUF4345 domain-containing protein n=1 Tax=Aureibacter tunicatorum TaxID=866807 RepID=A0AAE4BSL2_9BACT|nr:DUF4345 domain-containing protein [Aureibacter tunicatorum]MDR6241344.1 hypothetical protein [Aureibacter tunicatorum]BDD03603.1 hypothetical protein AUTU_10860 [Aureibacter tunicatorum]
MRNSKVLKTYLILSGILLMVLGGATLSVPVEFKAGSGIDIAENINIINDSRAFGALLLGVSIVSLLGAFRCSLSYTSTLLASLLFTSLGIGRLISILADGMPVDGLVKATGLELILGITGFVFFSIYQYNGKKTA